MYIASEKLIKKLKETFPDRIPRTPATVEDLRLLQGEQKVVDWLIDLCESESEELLNVWP